MNSEIKKLYDEYCFIEKDINKFNQIIFNNISDCDKKILKTNLFKYLEDLLNNGKFCDLFINYLNFIKNKNIRSLQKFNKYIQNVKYTPTFEEYTSILNIDLIENLIKEITDKNIDNIQNQNYDFINNNKFLIDLIETYCAINNIETINYNIEENEIYFIDDTLAIYLQEIKNYPLLSIQEEKDLFYRYKNGDLSVKPKIINSNLRLVISIARKYKSNCLDLLDLIQEGNIGLMNAIDRFDVTKGYKFSTYATWWIRQSIKKAIFEKSRMIRLPVHLQERINKFNNTITLLTKELNRNPSNLEIAKKLGVSINYVEEYLRLSEDVYSLNKKIGEDTEFGELIPYEEENEQVLSATMIEDINYVLEHSHLKRREIEVLKYRYGFNGYGNGTPMSLESIGKIFDITRERVRQIEITALRKLRNSTNVLKLGEYINSDCSYLKSRIVDYRNNTSDASRLSNTIRKSTTITSPKYNKDYVITQDVDYIEPVKTKFKIK